MNSQNDPEPLLWVNFFMPDSDQPLHTLGTPKSPILISLSLKSSNFSHEHANCDSETNSPPVS